MSPAATQEPPASESRSISSFYKPWSLAEGNAPQLEFHTCNAKNRLQVGSYGSGKSKPLLMEGIFHALEYPGSDSILLRKTVPDLKRTVIDKFLSDVPRWVYESYNQSDHIVRFHPAPELDAQGKPTGKMLQSKLRFGACEREADVGKYLSTEYVFIGFEELGEFSFAIWDALAGRNRCPIPGSRPCMAGATNPMGVGWSWIKKLWVDHKPFQGMDEEKYDPKDYEYFHSTVDQNPIYRNDQEYIRRLESSPLRDKIRFGRLDSVTGQFFDNWEPSRHMRPASAFLFEDWQPVWVGWDYGFGHFACIVFFTKAVLKPRWDGDKPRRVNVAIKEIVLHEKTPQEQTDALILAIPRVDLRRPTAGEIWTEEDEQEYVHQNEHGYRWNIEAIHFSWERFNRTVSNRTVADDVGELLQAAGLPFPLRSNTDRIAGWQRMYDLLDTDEFYILEGQCPTLAEAIPMLVRGDGVTHSIEDVVKPKGLSLNDDIADACLAAGTLIDTARGLVPIEQVTTADHVLTRKGFKRVLWAGYTGNKRVMQVDTLLITPNHPVFAGDGFVIASDTECESNLLIRWKSYLRARSIDATQVANGFTYGDILQGRKTDAARSFTSRFIAACTEAFRKITTSTTRTETISTINPTTSWQFQPGNIYATMPTSDSSGGSASVAVETSSQVGIEATLTDNIAPRNAPSIAENVNDAAKVLPRLGKPDSVPVNVNSRGVARTGLTTWQRIVSYAASLSPAIATMLLGFARATVGRKRTLSREPVPVYNLSVEGMEEYFANGILVHNCRYGIAGTLLDVEDVPEHIKRRERLAAIKDPMARAVAAYKEHNLKNAAARRPKNVVVPSWYKRARPDA